MDKKYLIIAGVVLVLIVIFGIYLFRTPNLCKKISEDSLKKECELCDNANDVIDCRDNVYIGFAMVKKDSSLCRKIVRDYNKEDCFSDVEEILKRDSGNAVRVYEKGDEGRVIKE